MTFRHFKTERLERLFRDDMNRRTLDENVARSGGIKSSWRDQEGRGRGIREVRDV